MQFCAEIIATTLGGVRTISGNERLVTRSHAARVFRRQIAAALLLAATRHLRT